MKSRSIEIDSSVEGLLEEPDYNNNTKINGINQINDNELPVNNNIDNINKKQGEVNDLTKSISWLGIDENSDPGILTYDKMHSPSKNLIA